MKEKQPTGFFEKKYLILLIIFLCALIYFGGYYFYSSEIKTIKRDKHEDIKAIADLKSNQIIQWRNERLSEAEFFSANENSKDAVKKILSGRDTLPAIEYFSGRLSVIRKNHFYRNIYIITPDNKIIFTLDKNFTKPDTSIQDEISDAIKNREIVLADFHFYMKDSVALDYIGPIISEDKVIALIIFHIDPSIYLFPLIDSWPTPSKTSETMIVKQDKDSVLFLNHVRLLNYPPLTLRSSMADTLRPVVQVIKGYKGIYEGIDYRGVKVLSHVQKLESTPWYMVTKVDQSEIYAELNFRLKAIIIFTLLFMMITGLGLYFLYYRNQRKLDIQYSEQLQKRVDERTLQLTQVHKNLELANKELESFSYTVSHDLRAPLRAISGFSNLLKEDLLKIKNTELLEITESIVNTSKQMDKMINQLLDFSRKTRKIPELKKIDMRQLFNDCSKELIRDYRDNNINIEIENIPEAYGDPVLIKQVILNLLSNAVKFSSFQQIPLIKVNGEIKNSDSVFSVADNGIGFDTEYSDKIFNVFQRLHNTNNFEGNGVGLAIVKRIILRHGGKVWAESNPGNGSVFYFSLPYREILDK